MRRPIALLVLALFALAACGGGGGSDSTATTKAPGGSSDGGATTTLGGSGGSGDVDCAAIKLAGADMIVPVQLLAQVHDPAAVEAIKSGTLGNLDIDKFLAALQTMHALDSFSSPLGNTKESLDFYEEAGTAMKALLAKDSVTQADVDAFNAKVGNATEFLGKQMAIAGSLDAAGC